MRTKKWTTKDKKKIRVCDMTTEHLQNTIRFLERAAVSNHQSAIDSAAYFLGMFNGEIAQIAAEEAMDEAFDAEPEDYLPPIYFDMVEELKERNA